jgi:molybdopterin/thiamine biosynthesis adenylyltransferase
MSLPRFLSRIADAAGPLLTDLDQSAIGTRLEEVIVALRIDAETAALDGQAPGFLLAVNLAARLYPNLVIDAPEPLKEEAVKLAGAIHPGIELTDGNGAVELAWGPGTPLVERVTVACAGWIVFLDKEDQACGACVAAAAMAAACFAMAQVFRAVFAEHLEHGRSAAKSWELNLVTLGEGGADVPWPEPIDIGTVHLAGCGAIGQAAVATLAVLPVSGTLVAVDHDTVDVGNLQRYVLTRDTDEKSNKPGLIKRALKKTDITVQPVRSRWGDDEHSGSGAETVLVALDSEDDRISVQASLPRAVYNGWTQPEDIGVSRHEHFGEEPCLACLYIPRGPKPSRSELIARALGQHELRVLTYIVNRVPVGAPLVPGQLQPTLRLALPPEASSWTERSLLEDVAVVFGRDPAELTEFAELTVELLYRDGICAGMLHGADGDNRAQEVSVPLAHQSALAGVMLAIEFFMACSPALRSHRPKLPEMRYDVLRDNPQVLPVPSSRRNGCICEDADFLDAYVSRWSTAAN